ncbi:hypothetical protein P1X14_21450 [Sphingomonas sp. AOB5]|uniref:hypothetical protein n=1 Tax=Sphingomonas sp. AOB5 TaxID=3034017 RepID=UPI0023F713CE|nr:hypothetical protein [Sphingomonas sp. AOB5]MDF7777835.1 hypothetical protein [Sphingomonas sp. AOB5]
MDNKPTFFVGYPVELKPTGLLGATYDPRCGIDAAHSARDTMIERRILRIEMVLRQLGIEIEMLGLPE